MSMVDGPDAELPIPQTALPEPLGTPEGTQQKLVLPAPLAQEPGPYNSKHKAQVLPIEPADPQGSRASGVAGSHFNVLPIEPADPQGSHASNVGASLAGALAGSHFKVQVRPEQLLRPPTYVVPKSPLARLQYVWHKDPAYKVLIIAIAMVVLAGMLFVSLASAALLHNPNLFAESNAQSRNSGGVSPSGTVSFRPTFPTPGGGTGSTTNSQPPAHSTPVIQLTNQPSPQPTPTAGGTLTVQITDIPSRVNNNTRVPVDVTTNQADISVRLVVTYNAFPYGYQSGQRRTDANGNVTLLWAIYVYSFGRVTATVVAVATDQNGQTVSSAPVTVEVFTRGG